jgi:DNA-binding NarL/FixJ family response regulator
MVQRKNKHDRTQAMGPGAAKVNGTERAVAKATTSHYGEAPAAAEAIQGRQKHDLLTPRERDVLRLVCEGLPNKLIQRRLTITEGTVKGHISNIISKLGVKNRLQAAIAAYRLGMVDDKSGAVTGKTRRH